MDCTLRSPSLYECQKGQEFRELLAFLNPEAVESTLQLTPETVRNWTMEALSCRETSSTTSLRGYFNGSFYS